MYEFSDSTGQTWQLELTYRTTKQIKQRTTSEFNIKTFLTDSGIAQLNSDPTLIAEIIVILCEAQFKNAIMTDPEKDERIAALGETSEENERILRAAMQFKQSTFEGRLNTETLNAATEALTKEVIDFFHKGQQTALHSWLKKTQDASAKYDTELSERLSELSQKVATETAKTVAEELTTSTSGD